MDTNTILLIINLILTVVISPLITILNNFIKRLSKIKCCSSEASLSRENTPPMAQHVTTDNREAVEAILKRLSQGRASSRPIEV